MSRFPVGGPREPVYEFLREHGYVQSAWSDKHWTRADGRTVQVYGTGSRAIVKDASERVLADAELEIALKA